MLLTEDTGIGDYHIRAYEPGAITVNESVYTKSLIIAPYKLQADWEPQSLRDLETKHLDVILAMKPEIVILGTGKKFILPPKNQLAPLYQQRLGVECMDTGAACRTYTALMSEGRNVIAALLIE